MSLAGKLSAIARASAERHPAAVVRVMHDATEALVASGAAERAVGVGDAFPALELSGPDGNVSTAASLREGPLVLTWFRGNW